jgi:ATP-dependent DNA ligase
VQADGVEWPVDVALARPVTQLPTGPSWAYEIKVDGHRTVLWRTEDGVRLQSRTGRDVTALWMDLAGAAMSLPPGVVLDGVM